MIYEIDLLRNQQVDHIIQNYNQSDFIDGSISNPSETKKNKMMKTHGQTYEFLNKYCSEIICSNHYFYSVFCARKISQIYFLWYEKQMKYGYHIDSHPIGGVNAHYSMTCFLSDPSQYEGGELVLKIGSKEIEYKLPRGKAVLYPTGLMHKVNEVKSGERKVFVCWIETAVKNSFIRNHMIELGNLITNVEVVGDAIIDAPTFLEQIEQLRINLMREYGDF